jgi:hypothetical protein
MTPAVPPAVRRLLATARTTRFRAERATAGRGGTGGGRGGGQALLAPVHLSIRDSRTLNIAVAALPDEQVERAHLVVSRGRRRFRIPLAFEQHAHGGLLLAGTATLRDVRDVRDDSPVPGAPANPRLAEGVWRLTVVTADARGRVLASPSTATPGCRPHPRSCTPPTPAPARSSASSDAAPGARCCK